MQRRCKVNRKGRKETCFASCYFKGGGFAVDPISWGLLPFRFHCLSHSLRLGPLWSLRVENRSELPLLIPAAGFGQGATQTQVGQYPARQVPTGGVNAETGQPMGLIWVHSHFQLQIYLIVRALCQLNRGDPKRMEIPFLILFFFFLNSKPDLGRCSKFIKYPSHFRRT